MSTRSQELLKFYRPPYRIPGYKSRVFIPVSRRGTPTRTTISSYVGGERGRGKGIKMFTLKLQRPQNSCMQRNQDCWPSSECTCCYTRSYVHTWMHIYIYAGCVFTQTHTWKPPSSVANARRDRTKYEHPSFSICFRLFEKWRTQSAVLLFRQACNKSVLGTRKKCGIARRSEVGFVPYSIELLRNMGIREIMNLVPKVCT